MRSLLSSIKARSVCRTNSSGVRAKYSRSERLERGRRARHRRLTGSQQLEILDRRHVRVMSVIKVRHQADIELGQALAEQWVRDRGLDGDVRQIPEQFGVEALLDGTSEPNPPFGVRLRKSPNDGYVEPKVERAHEAQRRGAYARCVRDGGREIDAVREQTDVAAALAEARGDHFAGSDHKLRSRQQLTLSALVDGAPAPHDTCCFPIRVDYFVHRQSRLQMSQSLDHLRRRPAQPSHRTCLVREPPKNLARDPPTVQPPHGTELSRWQHAERRRPERKGWSRSEARLPAVSARRAAEAAEIRWPWVANQRRGCVKNLIPGLRERDCLSLRLDIVEARREGGVKKHWRSRGWHSYGLTHHASAPR